MIIEIQRKLFNPDQIQTITDYWSMNCAYNEPECTAVIKFGPFNKLEFPGYSAKQLQDEINKAIKENQ